MVEDSRNKRFDEFITCFEHKGYKGEPALRQFVTERARTKRIHDTGDQDDIYQGVLIRLSKLLETHQASDSHALVSSLSRDEIADFFRARDRHRRKVQAMEDNIPSESVDPRVDDPRDEACKTLARLLAKLPAEERRQIESAIGAEGDHRKAVSILRKHVVRWIADAPPPDYYGLPRSWSELTEGTNDPMHKLGLALMGQTRAGKSILE